ncbi:hypothetical protein CSB45_10115 [candidate division KSB3 bacterium]|uniref:Uncharacterized protein n=1 Tax=candidate division KSB3 bacterium TaxID=2044937 RepID=A0A2G6E3Z0_9BACT|nr:MAG: hypothetical protein CSB45_10115 [candidate division KSB3 bacterium]PIE29331.1 MAG: hypothetical protein CSA57_08980 [candidate division KSB3 bacterium]
MSTAIWNENLRSLIPAPEAFSVLLLRHFSGFPSKSSALLVPFSRERPVIRLFSPALRERYPGTVVLPQKKARPKS